MRLVHLNEESVSLHLGRTPIVRGSTEGQEPKHEEETEAPATEESAPPTPSLRNAPSDLLEQITVICGRIKRGLSGLRHQSD